MGGRGGDRRDVSHPPADAEGLVFLYESSKGWRLEYLPDPHWLLFFHHGEDVLSRSCLLCSGTCSTWAHSSGLPVCCSEMPLSLVLSLRTLF